MNYMLVNDEVSIAREWEKYKGFTIRPLPSTEEYYGKLINNQHQSTRFMLYGGTPEIRTLFQDFGKEVVIIDRSSEIVRAMGLLTKNKVCIAGNEKFIEVDWLNINSQNIQFDFLIGDDAINMLEWSHFDVFLQNAAAILDNNGIFVCHLLVRPADHLINQDFDTIVNEYRTGVINNQYDLASRLNFICYDAQHYCMGWQQTIRIIGKDKLNLLSPVFDFVAMFGLCNSQFYCPPQSEFEKLVNKYFFIEEIFYPHEYEYCMFEPIYLLRKRIFL